MSDSLPQPSDSDDLEFTVHSFPVHDTGIGISQGYASDAEFMAAMDAERAKLPQEVQDAIRSAEAEMERRLLGG